MQSANADAQIFGKRRSGSQSSGSQTAQPSASPRATTRLDADGNVIWHELGSDREKFPEWMKTSQDTWVATDALEQIHRGTVFKSLTRPGIYYKNGKEDWPRTETSVEGFGPGGGRAIAVASEASVKAHAEAWARREGDYGGYYVVVAKASHPVGGNAESRSVADARPSRTTVHLPFNIRAKINAWNHAQELARSYEIVEVYETILLRNGSEYQGTFREGRYTGRTPTGVQVANGVDYRPARSVTTSYVTRYTIPSRYSSSTTRYRSGSVAGSIRMNGQTVTIYWD